VKVGPQDGTPPALYATTMLTVQYEFNLVAAGTFWESVQSAPPLPASPLSAPLFGEPDLATLQTKLAANGWRNPDGSFESRLWNVIAAVGPYQVEIMPTPLTWFTVGQKPSWFAPGLPALQPGGKPAPHPVPSTRALMVDHVKAMMLYTKRVQGPSSVGAWVAVNEIFDDTADGASLEFWGGLASTTKDRAQVRAQVVKDYLDTAHGVDPKGLLLVNDFHQELYPPALAGRKGKRAAAVSAMRQAFAKARPFHALMAAVMKHPGGLRGRVGVGYQMHFEQGPQYLAQKALYRTALRTGIRKLQRLGLRVLITEMVVKVNGVPDDPATYAARNYGADHTNACWSKQAQVYRDMVKTYLLEPGCDTVVFWGLVDEPDDEHMDYYGHLFDTTPAGTQGVYPTGTGLLRKPAYFAVLNALIEGGHGRHGSKRVPNWLRRWDPK
jgi:GH35 family endo-1,4-beta-xylanase